jgi:hypothetical protein
MTTTIVLTTALFFLLTVSLVDALMPKDGMILIEG